MLDFDFAVRRFLMLMFRIMGDRCFESGALVLGMSTRLRAFVAQLRAHSKRRAIARTHDAFQKPAVFGQRRLCGRACTGQWGGAGPQMEYALSPPLTGMCGSRGGAGGKGVLLWYTFRVGARDYVYMKLESHGSASPHHAVAAVRRYVLKRAPKTSLPVRRENAYKDGGVSAAAALAVAQKNREMWGPRGRGGEAEAYDSSVRVGMEMFVPSMVTAMMI